MFRVPQNPTTPLNAPRPFYRIASPFFFQAFPWLRPPGAPTPEVLPLRLGIPYQSPPFSSRVISFSCLLVVPCLVIALSPSLSLVFSNPSSHNMQPPPWVSYRRLVTALSLPLLLLSAPALAQVAQGGAPAAANYSVQLLAEIVPKGWSAEDWAAAADVMIGKTQAYVSNLCIFLGWLVGPLRLRYPSVKKLG